MKNNILLGFGFATILSAPWSDPTRAARGLRPGTLAFEELTLHLEVDLPSASSREAESSVHARSPIDLPTEIVLEATSAHGLAEIRVTSSTGRTVFELERPRAQGAGISEVSLECEGASLRDVLREYPPGDYLVQATTVDGMPVEGIAKLRSRFPGFFTVVSPPAGEVAPTEDVTIAWTSSRGAARYVLEVEQDESGFSLEVTLPPWQTSYTVPSQVLRPGQSYEYSLAVEGDTDNELEIEGSFVTPRASASPRSFDR